MTFTVGLVVCRASDGELPRYLVWNLRVKFLDFSSGD